MGGPDSLSEKDSLPQLLGVVSVDCLQWSNPSGTVLAAEGCLAQGHAPGQGKAWSSWSVVSWSQLLLALEA